MTCLRLAAHPETEMMMSFWGRRHITKKSWDLGSFLASLPLSRSRSRSPESITQSTLRFCEYFVRLCVRRRRPPDFEA